MCYSKNCMFHRLPYCSLQCRLRTSHTLLPYPFHYTIRRSGRRLPQTNAQTGFPHFVLYPWLWLWYIYRHCPLYMLRSCQYPSVVKLFASINVLSTIAPMKAYCFSPSPTVCACAVIVTLLPDLYWSVYAFPDVTVWLTFLSFAFCSGYRTRAATCG